MPLSSLPRASIAAALCAAAGASHASCGSAYCTLMTDRYAQGTGDPHVGWSADFRIEQVRQTRLRTGTRSIDAADVTGEEAIERRTDNLNAFTTLSYGIDAEWSLALRVPVVHRDHQHDLVDDESGTPGPAERWRFTRLGDVQLLARRQALIGDGATSVALFGGLKLPTGSRSVVDDAGVRAERALQPGTGTVDAIVGAAARRAIGPADAIFGQASVSHAIGSREDFRPGDRSELTLGWSHAFSPGWGVVLQANVSHRARDKGAQAEPGNSGSMRLDVSPGLTVATGPMSTLYAYVQVPIYQRVNGIQLVPTHGVAIGWTTDF